MTTIDTTADRPGPAGVVVAAPPRPAAPTCQQLAAVRLARRRGRSAGVAWLVTGPDDCGAHAATPVGGGAVLANALALLWARAPRRVVRLVDLLDPAVACDGLDLFVDCYWPGLGVQAVLLPPDVR